MAGTDEKFDVIIVDSTDPIGPGAVLFSREFYADCKRCLNPGGILVTQNGVPALQADELVGSVGHFKALFPDGSCYLAVVPTYVGGFMAMGWASLDPAKRTVDEDTLRRHYEASGIETRYYSPELHRGALDRKSTRLNSSH